SNFISAVDFQRRSSLPLQKHIAASRSKCKTHQTPNLIHTCQDFLLIFFLKCNFLCHFRLLSLSLIGNYIIFEIAFIYIKIVIFLAAGLIFLSLSLLKHKFWTQNQKYISHPPDRILLSHHLSEGPGSSAHLHNIHSRPENLRRENPDSIPEAAPG